MTPRPATARVLAESPSVRISVQRSESLQEMKKVVKNKNPIVFFREIII